MPMYNSVHNNNVIISKSIIFFNSWEDSFVNSKMSLIFRHPVLYNYLHVALVCHRCSAMFFVSKFFNFSFETHDKCGVNCCLKRKFRRR